MLHLEQAIERASSASPMVPAKVEALMKQASEAVETRRQPSRFRTITKVTWALTGLCTVGAAAAGMAALGAAAVGFGLGAIVSGVNDLLVPSPRGRRTPKAALACFGKSLKLGHWRKAYACLHPDTLPSSVDVPRILALDVMPDQVRFDSFAGFRRYWKSILRGKGSTIRLCRKVWFSTPKIEDGADLATGTVLLHVERSSAWCYLGLFLGVLPAVIIYMINRKTVPIDLQVTLFRHKSQWWLLPSQPQEAR